MNKFRITFILVFFLSFNLFSQKPRIWLSCSFWEDNVTKKGIIKKNKNTFAFSSDKDLTKQSIASYLMLANRFETVRIVLSTPFDGSLDNQRAVNDFKKIFIPAYKHDVEFWNSNRGIEGYPSVDDINKSIQAASIQSGLFEPTNNYSDISKLPLSVRDLVLELNNKKYNTNNPLYVLVWDTFSDVAIAVKHLQLNNNKVALQNLFIISSHSSSGNLTALYTKEISSIKNKTKTNIKQSTYFAQQFIKNESLKDDANFRFVNIGSNQTSSIENSYNSYFGPSGYQSAKVELFKKSKLGNLFVSSYFASNPFSNSLFESVYLLLDNYGLTFNDLNLNDQFSKAQENKINEVFHQQASYKLDELLAISNLVANNLKELKPQELNYPLIFNATGNPLVKHIRVADPDAHVWEDGRLWIYTSQDHDSDSETRAKAGHGYAKMDGYHVFSTTNMKTYIDHGEVLHSKNVAWGTTDGGYMWAPGAAFKNGMYYLYFPHMDKTMQWRTGVATSKFPQGPFVAEPNYIEGTSGIDPMCLVDDDGKSYLYFGHALVARLSDDMLTLIEKPFEINYGANNFREGPTMHKFNGKYYYSWTDWKDKENQGYYAIGNTPYGPFEYKGALNARPPGAQDHHSIIQFKGNWYYFYHLGNFINNQGEEGKGYRRNISVDFLNYNPDGTIQKIIQTKEGINVN